MKLTKKETNELEALQSYQYDHVLTPVGRARLKYLVNKGLHLCCLNAQCAGHTGKDVGELCPKCGNEVANTIEL